MSTSKRITSALLAFILMFSLAVGASALTPRIESVTETADGKYTVSGRTEGGDASNNTLYAATYDGTGKMTGVNAVTPGEGGAWSYTGGKSSNGADVIKTFYVDNNSRAPQGENGYALAVTTMAELQAALDDGNCGNIFIAKSMALSTGEGNNIGVNKAVTVSKNVTLTVPSGYALQLNSGARLTVAGELDVSSGAAVYVAGSHASRNVDHTETVGRAELMLSGGTVNNAGRLEIWPAGSDTNIDYDGGSGGAITGEGSGGALNSTGTIEIGGPYTDGVTGTYNNAGSVSVTGYTLDVSGTLNNHNELLVFGNGVLTGTGIVENDFRLRLEGGDITGTLTVNNRREIQKIGTYNDNGAGGFTFDPATIGEAIISNYDNAWIYEAAQVTSEAGAVYALANYTGENLEFNGGETPTMHSLTVPTGKILKTFVPLNLSGTLTVNGSVETFDAFGVSPDGTLNIGTAGNLKVRGTGDQTFTNRGTMLVDGALLVGVKDQNVGQLDNAGTLTIGETGSVSVNSDSELNNTGTISGTVTLISDGTRTGTYTGSGATRTSIGVSNYGDLTNVLNNDVYDEVRIENGFEIDQGLIVDKPLVIEDNAWLRIQSGKTLTLNAGATIFGWLENQGTLGIAEDTTLRLRGNLFNNGDGETNAAITLAGTLDVFPGAMMKNYGYVNISGGGAVRVGGTLAWGRDDAMPALGTTPGYTGYGDGRVESTRQTAGDLTSYAALHDSGVCDNIELGFNWTLSGNTTFDKGVIVPVGHTLTVPDGVMLTVTRGAWLNIGGTLVNDGTIIVANEDGNQGNVVINGGATLNTENGDIDVFGQLRIDDREHTAIFGEGNITYHFYTSLFDLSKGLENRLSGRSEFAVPNGDELSGYESRYDDWNNINSDGEKALVAFVLKNMGDRTVLERTGENDGKIYLEPYNWRTYGTIMAVLGQLWATAAAVNTDLADTMPDTVALSGKDAGDNVSVYDYGGGSELDVLLDRFMQALGNTAVSGPTTYTVNGSGDEQHISFKTFEDAVTVARNGDSGPNNISFTGCVFKKGIIVINSGSQYGVNLDSCTPGTVDGKTCGIYIATETDESGNPMFDLTDGGRMIIVRLSGTTSGVSVDADCTAQVESTVAGGGFTLNGVTYTGASALNGQSFTGKYQLDNRDEGITHSFHASGYTAAVAADGTGFREFHLWGGAGQSVRLDLDGSFTAEGNLDICDDDAGDTYGIILTGAVGPASEADTLNLNLHGTVDLSGLTAQNTQIWGDPETAVRLAAGGAWIAPRVVGDYDSPAVVVGTGDFTADGYAVALTKKMWDDNGQEYWGTPGGLQTAFIDGQTVISGLENTDDLRLAVTYGGNTVRWDNSMKRVFDDATRADFADALYTAYGTDIHFTSAENAADFVTANSLMTAPTDAPVTMYEIVSVLAKAAHTLGVTLNNYYPSGIARVDYANNFSYDSAFETELRTLAAAFALGSRVMPFYDDGAGEAAVYFDGGATVGRTTYDPNGNTELSALMEAFEAACAGKIYIGNSPNIAGAAFAGGVTMTMGRSGWSDVNFYRCTFADGAPEEAQALNIVTDSGGNANFDNCTFTPASGFRVNFSTVTPDRISNDMFNLNNVPAGTVITTNGARVNAGCNESGSLTVGGVTVMSQDFSATGGYFNAGMRWDNYGSDEAPVMVPCLGVDGAVAAIGVTGNAAPFGGFNINDDCWDDVTITFAPEWVPDYVHGLGLRCWNGQTLVVAGTLTGGTGTGEDAADLGVSVEGTVDMTGVTFTGNCGVYTGKWVGYDQILNMGGKNLSIFYDEGNDAGKNIDVTMNGGTVYYYNPGAEDRVTVDGFNGISLSGDGKVWLGDLTGTYTSGTDSGDYTLTLYGMQNKSWTPVSYTVDTTDTGNYALVPGTPFASPYRVKLTVAYTDPDTGDRDDSCTFSIAWTIDDGSREVTSLSELSDALDENSGVNKIRITADLALSPMDETPTKYDFGKDVEIASGCTLTVEAGVTLNVDAGLTISGNLSVEGIVNVFGWLDDRGWDGHVETSGTGTVTTYTELGTFAEALCNRFYADYGLTHAAETGTYENCYAADYYNSGLEDPNTAAGITALNFLIENEVIPSSATNLNGWDKIKYSDAMAILGGLAAKVGTAMGKTITGYGISGWTQPDADENLLTLSINNSNEPADVMTLIDSFLNAVGTLTVTDSIDYSPALYNHLLNFNKAYSDTVTVNCTGDSYFLFAGCTFDGDLIINCAGGDAGDNFDLDHCTINGNLTVNGATGAAVDSLNFISCTVNGGVTVYDSDGNTNVYFGLESDASTVAEGKTVTVAAKAGVDVPDSARVGMDCDSVILFNLPSGVPVLSSGVSTAVINNDTASTVSMNGVAISGSGETGSDKYVTVSTYWMKDGETYTPALVLCGSTASVDATGETGHFTIISLYEDQTQGIYASNTLFIPKAGTQTTLTGSASAHFSADFDGSGEGRTQPVIEPAVHGDETSGYLIDVPDIEYSYRIDTSGMYVSATASGGHIALENTVNPTAVKLEITYGGITVAFEPLPYTATVG